MENTMLNEAVRMTTNLQSALELAERGFWVFPVRPWMAGDKESDGKKPAVKFKNAATREPAAIKAWFASNPRRNVGIYTGKFGDARPDGSCGALVVIDVDNKHGKHGDASLISLELQGLDLPETLTTVTASGTSRHLFFCVPQALPPGVNVLGPGLDIRSDGSYVVGPGSTIDGGEYRFIDAAAAIAEAPAWLRSRRSIPR